MGVFMIISFCMLLAYMFLQLCTFPPLPHLRHLIHFRYRIHYPRTRSRNRIRTRYVEKHLHRTFRKQRVKDDASTELFQVDINVIKNELRQLEERGSGTILPLSMVK